MKDDQSPPTARKEQQAAYSDMRDAIGHAFTLLEAITVSMRFADWQGVAKGVERLRQQEQVIAFTADFLRRTNHNS